jgi:hypothetical protein
MNEYTEQTGGLSELDKIKKPKTLSDRIKGIIELHSKSPNTPGLTNSSPLYAAGCNVHNIWRRMGFFKEFENQLLAAFYEGERKSPSIGEISLWQELVTILRARANLPDTTDFLETFAEDCRLVADEIEKEVQAVKDAKL